MSAYDILNAATARQLRDLETLRNDIAEKSKVASAVPEGMEGSFLQNDLSVLQNEYLQAKNDIIADKNTQLQILNEQRRAQREADKRNNRLGVGGFLGGLAGAGIGFATGGPLGAFRGYGYGSEIGSGLGGLL
jgi:hypothetical protein